MAFMRPEEIVVTNDTTPRSLKEFQEIAEKAGFEHSYPYYVIMIINGERFIVGSDEEAEKDPHDGCSECAKIKEEC